MGYIVRMPQMGMSMDQGTVVEWMAAEGEPVEEGDVIAVVESEKAANDVEAREDGRLRQVVVPEGGVVEPGDPIGIFAVPDEDISDMEQEVAEADIDAASEEIAASSDDSASATVADTGEESGGTGGAAEDVQATPGARQLADDEGVDLSQVDGTGPQGVIVEGDVADRLGASNSESAEGDTRAAAEDVRATPGARQVADKKAVDLTAVTGSGPGGVITEEDVGEHLGPATQGATRTVIEAHPLSGMQKTISDRLSESNRNAVHVTLNRSVDTTAVQAVQESAESAGVDISLTDLLLKALGRTLREHPEFNAVFEEEEHRLVEEVNIGVAVDVEAGLVTPVVPEVTEKTVEAVSESREELTDRVLADDFTMDDLSGGTFTISNLGLFGIDHFDPIINPPQIAILGIGRIDDDGQLGLSLSFDHRIVNGADAARFLETLCETLTDRSALTSFFEADIAFEPDSEFGPRELRIETESGLSGRYRTGYGDVAFDEPTDVGGTGAAPSPFDHLLGALGSCLSLSVRQMADREGLLVDPIECDVAGTPTHGPIETIDVKLTLATEAPEGTVEAIVTKAERSCYVASSLSDELDVSLTWTRA